MFASWENVCLRVCSSLSIPGEMLLRSHMADTFKIFYKWNSRHCKDEAVNSIQRVAINSRSRDITHSFMQSHARDLKLWDFFCHQVKCLI